METFNRHWVRSLAYVAGWIILFILLFGALAEWLFWDEFEARFNFIAVDYLVYTTEVIGNIRESYPLPQYIAALVGLTSVIHLIIVRTGIVGRWLAHAAEPWKNRYRSGGVWLLLPLVLGFAVSEQLLPDFNNNFNRELAKNGTWSLFAAFHNNELDFRQFYPTMTTAKVFEQLHHEITEDGSQLIDPSKKDSLRWIRNSGAEIYPNVIQITVESLSARYLGIYNQQSKLTPNLDAIAGKSLVFDNFYATGTRTDRGMEALSLSLPPTPGRSLIKRPNNEHLFTVGSIFRSRGYDTAFLYGGYGYFEIGRAHV
jgi:phosphoglycerol transferase MdoB-like AlkP superfamily enzyme